jgi:hypothetical protein
MGMLEFFVRWILSYDCYARHNMCAEEIAGIMRRRGVFSDLEIRMDGDQLVPGEQIASWNSSYF